MESQTSKLDRAEECLSWCISQSPSSGLGFQKWPYHWLRRHSRAAQIYEKFVVVFGWLSLILLLLCVFFYSKLYKTTTVDDSVLYSLQNIGWNTLFLLY